MQLSGPEILMISSVLQEANTHQRRMKSAAGVLHLISLPVFQFLNSHKKPKIPFANKTLRLKSKQK